MAVAALVLGIIGIPFGAFFLIAPLVAFIFGLVAARSIKSSGGRLTGLSMARAGWILGIIGALIGAAALIAVIASEEDDDRVSDVPLVTVNPNRTTADQLVVGDCIDLPDLETTIVFSVDRTPCDGPHDGVVYLTGDLTATSDVYPGDDEISLQVFDRCDAEWDAFVGEPYETSVYDIYIFYPTERSWPDDTGFSCVVFHLEGEPLDGTEFNR